MFKKLSKKASKLVRSLRSHKNFHVGKHDVFRRINFWRKLYPKNSVFNRSWGSLKKSHRLGLRHLSGGNNSASAFYIDAGGYQPGGYVYNGRTISEMM